MSSFGLQSGCQARWCPRRTSSGDGLASCREVIRYPAQRRDRLAVARLVVLGGPRAGLDDDHVGRVVDEQVLAVHAEAGERVEAGRAEGPPLVAVAVVRVAAR